MPPRAAVRARAINGSIGAGAEWNSAPSPTPRLLTSSSFSGSSPNSREMPRPLAVGGKNYQGPGIATGLASHQAAGLQSNRPKVGDALLRPQNQREIARYEAVIPLRSA